MLQSRGNALAENRMQNKANEIYAIGGSGGAAGILYHLSLGNQRGFIKGTGCWLEMSTVE